MFWGLMKLAPSELFAETYSYIQNLHDQAITDRTFYYILKSKKVIVGSFHYSNHTPLISCFSSHDGLVGNTLSYFTSKVMTRKTLAIEEIPAIIKPSIVITINS